MPGIYKIYCNSCSYSIESVMSVTVAIADSGSEIICPHPCECSTAEDNTGKSWNELVRNNRIRHRYAFVCLNCGENDFYGPDELTEKAMTFTHIGGIVYQPSVSEAKKYKCRSCGKKSLYPICRQTGCLLTLKKFTAQNVRSAY